MKTEKDKFKHIDPLILKSYLEGKGDKKKQQQIADWFSDIWTNEELKRITHERWVNTPEDITVQGYDEDRIHDRIHHILRLEESAAYEKERRKIMLIKYFQRVAAVIVIPLALFTLLIWKGNLRDNQNVSNAVIYSPFGTRTSFTLPDGSTGWLSGDSYLNFPTRFTGKSRTVELTGEAYFNIIKNPKKTFTVIADELKVKVYGTSFNVMVYPDEQTIEVTLEKGAIEVFNEDEFGRERSLGTMTPGERGVLWKGTSIFKTDSVDIDQFTSWKEGKLVFRNESMPQVVRKMNRWYNVNIIIRDSRLENYTYRATFVDEKLDEVLKIFQYTSPIVFKELGRETQPDGTYGKRTIELYYRPDYLNRMQ